MGARKLWSGDFTRLGQAWYLGAPRGATGSVALAEEGAGGDRVAVEEGGGG
jgi:hypothetical protein